MRLAPKTWALLAIAAALLIAVGWSLSPAAAPPALPTLPATAPEDVTKIVISSPIDRLEIDRTAFDKANPAAERWALVTPLQYPADVAQVHAILHTFAVAIPMDAKLDAGNLKDYQLEDQDAKVVELYTTAETPALQVIVGHTVGPTSSFVRLPGADTVYRAAVGPRQRYDEPAADWRDKVVLDVEKDTVTRLTIAHAGEHLAFTRSNAGGHAAWALEPGASTPPPGFALDGDEVESVARALGKMAASDIHNAGFPAGLDTPLSVATLTVGAAVHTITLGSASDAKTAYIRVDDRSDVYAVSPRLQAMLTQPLAAYRNRDLFAFDPTKVRRLALTEGSITVEIERGSGEATWSVLRPANMDVDGKLADALAASLATMRASAIPADDAFGAGAGKLVVTLADGSTQTMELGPPEKDADGRQVVRVRTRAGVYDLRLQNLGEIERVFGR